MVSLATEALPTASNRSMGNPARDPVDGVALEAGALDGAAAGAGAEVIRPESGRSRIVPDFGFEGGCCEVDCPDWARAEPASVAAARQSERSRIIVVWVRSRRVDVTCEPMYGFRDGQEQPVRAAHSSPESLRESAQGCPSLF